MLIPIVQVDAFTREPFRGNPAAVCVLERWLDDATMGAIAAENNLSETAFLVPRGDGSWDLRWFTPTVEVDLCGHATLASGHVVLTRHTPDARRVVFHTRSGALTVERDGGRLALDLPSLPAAPWDDGSVERALGARPAEVLRAVMALAVLESEAAVRAVAPDMALVAALDADGLIVTAPGDDADFVSRYFAPHAGIPEDPVTGSAHCTLTPYWAARLGRPDLFARQVSARGGELWCSLGGDRVRVAGHVAEVLVGTLHLPDGGTR